MEMSIESRYEEAKQKNWGIYCADWATCQELVECSEACPFGGVSEEKQETDKD